MLIVLVAIVLLAARFSSPARSREGRGVWPVPALVCAAIVVVAGSSTIGSAHPASAAVLLIALYALLLAAASFVPANYSVIFLFVLYGFLAFSAGVAPVALEQVESHFADEEFFAGLRAAVLGVFWALLLISSRFVWRQGVTVRRGVRLGVWGPALAALFILFVAVVQIVHAYQASFFPDHPPTFAGLSPSAPFVCGEAPSAPQHFEGEDVFRRLLARVEANPRKEAPEYGMLALGHQDVEWAQEFRGHLLAEARAKRFSGPAHSVKSIQYDAALRVYYYARIIELFPDLFTATEHAAVRDWFEAINRRALTVEWVDGLYALAFGKWPEGPYENQETGAGLLALLEWSRLSSPELSARNRDYLARHPGGWAAGFRNTDDTLLYHREWLHNAYFQSLYTAVAPSEAVRLSFDWLLLQTRPSGEPLRYNHPGTRPMAATAYLGASLLNDPTYVWLAGQGVEALEAAGGVLRAEPGVEAALALQGRAPAAGSCLLYGDSGLPTRRGHLAPDKIVFRDGWSPADTYLLLNLRFTGWHRYKATNAVVLVDQGGALAGEQLGGRRLSWLPRGRSLFRDKRIPRENLNGFLVEKRGMNAFLYALTGIGSRWAQDPPVYARVERFQTGPEVDVSRTVLEGWSGWHHQRDIHFFHNGPVVIVDRASGTPGLTAAVAWHVAGDGTLNGGRITLRGGERPAELVLVPLDSGSIEVAHDKGSAWEISQRVLFTTARDDRLGVASLFLTGEWVGAAVEAVDTAEGAVLRITRGRDSRVVSLN